MCSEIGCKCGRSNYCSETGFHSHFCHFQTLTPSHTNSNLLATATKYHLIFKSPSLSYTHPYNLLLITSSTVLFMEMHSISCICHTNIQALQELSIFTAIIYLIILLCMPIIMDYHNAASVTKEIGTELPERW